MRPMVWALPLVPLVLVGMPRTLASGPDIDEMYVLTRGLQAIEKALEAGNLGQVVKEARVARDASTSLEHWPAPEGRGADQSAEVAHLAALFDELATLAAEDNGAGAAQVVPDIRASCVSCHARFRTNERALGYYPSTGNLVHVRAQLHDVDGEPLEDRSWVLVFLERDAPSPDPQPWLRARPSLSQAGRQFTPRVLPVVVGTTVEFPNDDEVFHNVFSLSRAQSFDLGIYEPGKTRPVTFDRPGLVKVHCNIHPEMSASVVVLEQPWFALTDSSGEAVLSGMPSGQWKLRAWNDHGVEDSVSIVVEGQPLEVTLDLHETKRVLTHRNKFGKPYPKSRTKY